MNRTLSQQQKEEIRQSITQGNFSAEAAINKLMSKGYELEEAKALIVAEIKAYKKAMFDKIDKRNSSEDGRQFVFIGIVMISLIGPLFDISSPIWYAVAIGLCGLLGYLGAKTKPIAGILGGVIMSVILPFAHNFYFRDRTTFIKIEMAIPIIMAAVPAFLVYYALSKTVYAHVEND